MRIITIFVLLVFGNSAFSKNIEFQVKIKFKKGNITQVRETNVVAKLGSDFEIPFTDDNSFKLKMKATEKFENSSEFKKVNSNGQKKGLLIKGKIFVRDGGEERLVASPQIISNYNEETILETADENGETFKMQITPVLKL